MTTYATTPTITAAWPTEPAARRAHALGAVEEIREELTLGAAESEERRRLSDRSAAALRSSGLLGIMTPDDLGGNVVGAVTAFEIVEKLGHIDPATAWTATILLEGAGELATVLAPATARKLFDGGLALKAASLKPGSAERVEGGYRVSGRWDFVSGLHHADYVGATFLVDDAEGRPVRRAAVLPKAGIQVLDDWRVLGMRGTGSSSFAVEGAYVPDEMIYDPMGYGQREDTPPWLGLAWSRTSSRSTPAWFWAPPAGPSTRSSTPRPASAGAAASTSAGRRPCPNSPGSSGNWANSTPGCAPFAASPWRP